MATPSPAPLTGTRVIELAGLAPVPYCGLLLASYGASVLRIDRPHRHAHSSHPAPRTADSLTSFKSSVALDLKSPASHSILLALLASADVLVEPFRPGVLESLGLGPEKLLKLNPRLIIARLTGFRRDGKYAAMAGHDINYLAVSGILSQLGGRGRVPEPPANILADFAGGGLMCAFGIVMAMLARQGTGKGQLVESNMVDGVGSLGSMIRMARKTPMWDRPRGENILDGGCPWYGVYETKEGGYIAVGALEEKFFEELVKGLELGAMEMGEMRIDRERWDEMRGLMERTFKQRTRKEWEAVFDGTDACATPVLSLGELEDEGYEIRQAVGLSGSPGRKEEDAWNTQGLGIGVGGEKILEEWLGWKKGKHYKVEGGALARINGAKL